MNWLRKLFTKQQAVDDRDTTQSNAYDLIGGDKVIRAIAHDFYQQ
jgi:hemoglobin